jgi:ribosomal protein L12E/L44/L45/RPP1/RPP2
MDQLNTIDTSDIIKQINNPAPVAPMGTTAAAAAPAAPAK